MIALWGLRGLLSFKIAIWAFLSVLTNKLFILNFKLIDLCGFFHSFWCVVKDIEETMSVVVWTFDKVLRCVIHFITARALWIWLFLFLNELFCWVMWLVRCRLGILRWVPYWSPRMHYLCNAQSFLFCKGSLTTYIFEEFVVLCLSEYHTFLIDATHDLIEADGLLTAIEITCVAFESRLLFQPWKWTWLCVLVLSGLTWSTFPRLWWWQVLLKQVVLLRQDLLDPTSLALFETFLDCCLHLFLSLPYFSPFLLKFEWVAIFTAFLTFDLDFGKCRPSLQRFLVTALLWYFKFGQWSLR